MDIKKIADKIIAETEKQLRTDEATLNIDPRFAAAHYEHDLHHSEVAQPNHIVDANKKVDDHIADAEKMVGQVPAAQMSIDAEMVPLVTHMGIIDQYADAIKLIVNLRAQLASHHSNAVPARNELAGYRAAVEKIQRLCDSGVTVEAKEIEEVIWSIPAATVPPVVQAPIDSDERTELETYRRVLSGLPEGAIDGGWTAAGICAHAKKLEQHIVTLDHSETQTINDRDCYQEWADKLADAIAKLTGVDIGEHSSANNPWRAALEAIDEYEPVAAPIVATVPSEPTFTLNARQLRAALEFIAPDFDTDEDQRDCEISMKYMPARILVENEPMEAGLWAWVSDYPEEGCIQLRDDETNFYAAPISPTEQASDVRNAALEEAADACASVKDKSGVNADGQAWLQRASKYDFVSAIRALKLAAPSQGAKQ